MGSSFGARSSRLSEHICPRVLDGLRRRLPPPTWVCGSFAELHGGGNVLASSARRSTSSTSPAVCLAAPMDSSVTVRGANTSSERGLLESSLRRTAANCSPQEISILVRDLACMDGRNTETLDPRLAELGKTLFGDVLIVGKAFAANALTRVEAFEKDDLARLAGALCRLGAEDEAWQLYSRAQRAAPSTSGCPELRAVVLAASERSRDVVRALAVLTHLAIFPRVARSPTWRAALATSAVLMLWRLMGLRAAREARRALDDDGMRKSQVAAALWHRIDSLLCGTDDGFGLDTKASAGLQALSNALRAGPKDRTADKRKEFDVLRHVCANAFPWGAEEVLRQMEIFGSKRTFIKIAGGVKRRVLERVALEAPPGLVVELGSYIGYSSAVIALARGAEGHAVQGGGLREQPGVSPLVITAELDPVNAVVARNVLALAGLTAEVEVWVGPSCDVAHYISKRFGPGSVAMLFMDHRGSLFHEDLRAFEELGLLASGARIVADNVLKPGAPHFLWHVSQSSAYAAEPSGETGAANHAFGGGGGGSVDFVLLPEFGLGHQCLEDWMAVCRYSAEAAATIPPPPPPAPKEIVDLAERCDEMRRRSLLRGGVDMAAWAAHSSAMQAALKKLGIVATTVGDDSAPRSNEQ